LGHVTQLFPELEERRTEAKAYLVGGGIGSLADTASMTRDGNCSRKYLILEAASILGVSLDGAEDVVAGYSIRSKGC
jgi:oleate hydratase